MEQMRDSGLGVPPPHPFAPQGYAREQAGSGFPLQVRARITGLAGFPLRSVTRNTSTEAYHTLGLGHTTKAVLHGEETN